MEKNKYTLMLPIEGENLVNLSNSILKEMGVQELNETFKDIDKQLSKKNYRNIILLIYDGMGSSILNKYLSKEEFLQKHKQRDISSIFPATTVAATTSILTGLEPAEHGWLGWDMYFEDDDETISVFRNTIKDTERPAKHKVKERPDMVYKTIIDRINEQTKNQAYIVWPFDKEKPCNTLDEINSRIIDICKSKNEANKNKKFIYAYYDNPDKIMHQEGFNSINVKNEMIKINQKTEELYKQLPPESLLIITADHGHIECTYETISENKDVYNMLARTTALEPRACVIKLKSNINKETFEKKFKETYKDKFKLYSKEEVIQNKLFGKKIKHSRVEENIGDYIAVATKDACLRYDEKGKTFKTYHAGITKDEMEIPLIMISS